MPYPLKTPAAEAEAEEGRQWQAEFPSRQVCSEGARPTRGAAPLAAGAASPLLVGRAASLSRL
jgi:hypothetical protein